jgi:hypothetical protein
VLSHEKKETKKSHATVPLKIASKSLQRKEHNCAFENLSFRCGLALLCATCPTLIADDAATIYTYMFSSGVQITVNLYSSTPHLDVPGCSSCISSRIFCVAISQRRPRPFSGYTEESTLPCRVNLPPATNNNTFQNIIGSANEQASRRLHRTLQYVYNNFMSSNKIPEPGRIRRKDIEIRQNYKYCLYLVATQ